MDLKLKKTHQKSPAAHLIHPSHLIHLAAPPHPPHDDFLPPCFSDAAPSALPPASTLPPPPPPVSSQLRLPLPLPAPSPDVKPMSSPSNVPPPPATSVRRSTPTAPSSPDARARPRYPLPRGNPSRARPGGQFFSRGKA